MEEEIKHEINGFLSNSNFCACGKFPCVYKYEGSQGDCSLSVTNERQVDVISRDQCCRCLTTSDAKFRPLVGSNGEIMCDMCYREIFPLPEIVNEDESINEEEECRICLEQGIIRGCCDQYFCHFCYFKCGKCPGCNSPAALTGVSAIRHLGENDVSRLHVGMSWMISVSLTLFLVFVTIVALWNEFTFPVTYFGYTCRGFFPTCNMKVCIDVTDDEVLIGMPLQYRRCKLEYTTNSILGEACVFDEDLFERSKNKLGYDLCEYAARDIRVIRPNETFIFYDDFDGWEMSESGNFSLTPLATSKWINSQNANASDVCGFVRDSAYKSFASYKIAESSNSMAALVFSGALYRYAETIDFDVAFGGKLDFYIKLGPENDDKCKTAYGGDVSVAYSKDEGQSWHIFATYEVWKYRNDYFSHVIEEIPTAAHGGKTRFRWQQTSFEALRDYWAIDEVSIIRNFNALPSSSEKFIQRKSEHNDATDIAQCCVQSELCEHNPDLLLRNNSCVGGEKKVMTGPHIYLGFSIVITIILCAYRYVVRAALNEDFIGKRIKPHKNETINQTFRFRVWKFTLRAECAWQSFTFFVLVTPFALGIAWLVTVSQRSYLYYLLSTSNDDTFENRVNAPGSTPHVSAIALAILLDGVSVVLLAKHVFCLAPSWIPKVEIDSNPQKSVLVVGEKMIQLSRITSISIFSKAFSMTVNALFILGGFPFATACISIKYLWMPRFYSRILIMLCGILLIFKTFFGSSFLVKTFLLIPWVLTRSPEKRRLLGLSLAKQRTKVVASTYSVLFLMIGICSISPLLKSGISVWKVIAFVTCCIPFGSFFGTLISMLQDIPVNPHFILTTWPSRGYSIVYEEKVDCPFRFSCLCCGEAHTCRRLLILPFNETNGQDFREIIRGKYSVKSS